MADMNEKNKSLSLAAETGAEQRTVNLLGGMAKRAGVGEAPICMRGRVLTSASTSCPCARPWRRRRQGGREIISSAWEVGQNNEYA